jgi:hypothetical protein
MYVGISTSCLWMAPCAPNVDRSSFTLSHDRVIPRGSSSTTRPGSPHAGSISIGVTLKTFTPLRDRFGNRRERGGGLFNRLTVVVDDAPPPVWVAGSRDSKHVHLDDLDAQDNSSARNVARSSQSQGVRRLLRLSEARWKAPPG